MAITLRKDSLLHAVQSVAALSRMLEEYLATDTPTTDEREAIGELVADMDSALDNLAAAYDDASTEIDGAPSSDDLLDAFHSYTLRKK